MELSESPLPLPATPAALPLPPLPPGTFWSQPGAYPVPLGYFGAGYRRPPRVWTVFVAYVIAVVAAALISVIIPATVLIAQYPHSFGSKEQLTATLLSIIVEPGVLLGTEFAMQVVLVAVTLAAALLSGKSVVRRLRLNPSTLTLPGYVIASIGALAVSFLFSGLIQLLGVRVEGTLKVLSDVIHNLTPTQVVFAGLVIGLSPGIGEEFLTRGYIQTRLVERWGRWIGIAITAVLFGVMHMDLLQSPLTAGIGIYLGYLAERTGSIRPAMVCHMVNNSIAVVIGRYFQTGGEEPTRESALWLALISFAVLVLCTLYLRFRVKPPVTAVADSQQLGAPLSLPGL